MAKVRQAAQATMCTCARRCVLHWKNGSGVSQRGLFFFRNILKQSQLRGESAEQCLSFMEMRFCSFWGSMCVLGSLMSVQVTMPRRMTSCTGNWSAWEILFPCVSFHRERDVRSSRYRGLVKSFITGASQDDVPFLVVPTECNSTIATAKGNRKAGEI